jgi:hypothetical protein
VPRHHFLEGSKLLAGAPGIAEAEEAVRALSTAMRAEGSVALARVVVKDDADPYLAALVPSTSGVLLLHRLPFADDIRDYAFPSYDADALSSAQTSAVSSFVDAMTLQPQEAARAISRTFDPTRQAFMITVAERLADMQHVAANGEGTTRADAAPPALQCFRSPWLAVGEGGGAAQGKVAEALLAVKAAFPLAVTAAGSKDNKRRAYWGDFKVDVSGGGDAGKKIKVEVVGPSQEPTTEDLACQADLDPRLREENQVAKARSAVNQYVEKFTNEDHIPQPDVVKGDFEDISALIAGIGINAPDGHSNGHGHGHSNGNSNGTGSGAAAAAAAGTACAPSTTAVEAKRALQLDAMNALLPALTKYIMKGASSGYYRGSAELVHVMRAAALAAGAGAAFNTVMQDSVGPRFRKVKGFWDLLVKDDVTLIVHDEDPASAATRADAEAFLRPRAAAAAVDAPQPMAVVDGGAEDDPCNLLD